MVNYFLEVYDNLSYFIGLTFDIEVLWNVVPLVIATFLILLYFERYKEEQGGWNSYLTNSLVLLFVSIALFRYIHGLSDLGVQNFVDYYPKTIAVVFLLLISLLLLRFNFEHLLPKQFAKYLSSTLTVNLTAYGIILFVYSDLIFGWIVIVSLIVLILLLSVLLNALKKPFGVFFNFVEREKFREQLRNIRESIFQIKELKHEVVFREKKLKEVKKKEIKEEKQAKKAKEIADKGLKETKGKI
ncbi:hypothetical protein HOE04_03375 [archaeon]|jgi:hypothetical protein|nr:hypothetical protein [archaeon]